MSIHAGLLLSNSGDAAGMRATTFLRLIVKTLQKLLATGSAGFSAVALHGGLAMSSTYHSFTRRTHLNLSGPTVFTCSSPSLDMRRLRNGNRRHGRNCFGANITVRSARDTNL